MVGGMNRISVIIVALCSVAGGLLVGLAIGALRGESFAEVTADRDRLAAELATAKKDILAATADKQSTVTVTPDSDQAEDSNRNREIAEKALADQLKGLALLQMCIDNDGVLQILRSEDFRRKFKADWYWPALAYKAIGGHWFAKDMFASGLITQEELDRLAVGSNSDDAKRAESARVKTWRGTGMKTTDLFLVRTPKWKLSWKSSGYLAVTAHSPNGDAVATGSSKSGSDSTVVHQGTGEFYLRIMAVTGSYEVWAEEL